MAQRIDLQKLLGIDGGLSYIIHRYPDAEESQHKKNRKFKLREEKTASAALKRLPDGTWIVTDFGDDSKGRSAVQVAMREDGSDFVTALKVVARFYNFEGEASPEVRADFNAWPAGPDEAEGSMSFKYREFTTNDLRAVFADGAWRSLGKDDEQRRVGATQLCSHYRLKCLASYTYTKEGKTMEFGSNDLFPIFLWDEGDWKKIYKPRAEKQHRFQSYGPKPESFIHGLQQADKRFAELQAKADEDLADNEGDEGEVKKSKKPKKLPELILCTGGSDALNVAALGCNVVWLNSETAELPPVDYARLSRIAATVYNLPDIDATGKIAAHKLAMKYLELRTIYLPDSLLKRLDNRGKPCKDVRDFLGMSRKYDFDELKSVAVPYMFWDEEISRDKDGEVKVKFGRVQTNYQFNNVHGYNFLFRNGYARFPSAKEKEGYVYVRVENNVVRPIMANEVKQFVHNFLEERRYGTDLRNTIYRSPQLSESSLSNLHVFNADFKTFGPDFQYIFFEKKAWRVTGAGVQEEQLGGLDKCIWQHKVIVHPAKVLPPMFETTKTEAGEWDIAITNSECMFFRFLIQTCRTHWRAELEDRLGFWQLSKPDQDEYVKANALGADDVANLMQYQNVAAQQAYMEQNKFAIDGGLLTEEEVGEQKRHLLNRIFSIGYALHRYKNPARPWAVFAMDGKLSDEGESHGGAGKGLIAKAIYKMLTKVQLDGRNPKLTENPHVFENVDLDVDLIHVEDSSEYLNFGFFFAPLTSAMTINPKQKRSFEIGFEDSPKFWFDTNFGDRMTDPSSLRRKLYTVFGDYYHENSGDYKETRTPADDFGGKTLFTDWEEVDWNRFYNFMAQCLSFYLRCEEKLTPPMGNLSRRNLMSEMGDHFRNWADVYYAPESDRLGKQIMKKEAMDDFINFSKLKTFTATRFMRSLKAWSAFNGYELNPKELRNSQGRIVRKVNGKSEEMVYMHVKGSAIVDGADGLGF